MAVIMVPVMFLLGKTVWNRKAGIVAAGLISVVSIQYFSLSSYGWTDHHIAEVLFSTLFFLAYIFTLIVCEKSSGRPEKVENAYFSGFPLRNYRNIFFPRTPLFNNRDTLH